MRIVVDAMGTDNFPVPDVEGSVLAARELGVTILLVGDEPRIDTELKKYNTAGLDLQIVHAPDMIHMDDKPSVVGKGKPNSSMHIGMGLVRDGEADAFVSMGNTGAAYAIAMLYTLRRIPGVRRPALSGIFPFKGKPIVFLDVGANAECKPDWLAQFALMGSIYAANALGLEKPRVGLLSNGEEEGKGTELVREAAEIIKTIPVNFIGNIEPKEIFAATADVVVADGFTGNLLTKTYEAATRYLANVIRDEIRSNPLTMLGGALIRPAMMRVRKRMDTFEVGGAPLLGVQGVVIIGHGRSNAFAVKNAIKQATLAVKGGIVQAIRQQLEAVATRDEL